jgi:hypothetical protein
MSLDDFLHATSADPSARRNKFREIGKALSEG